MAINTLAGMGILTEDDGLVDAALSEILSLPIEQRHELDPRRDVTYLLVQHYLGLVRTQLWFAECAMLRICHRVTSTEQSKLPRKPSM
jgi:hypothetical protein